MESRLPRFKRAPIVASMQLEERDCQIIQLVHRHRFLRSGQIISFMGGSQQQILRRLKLLYHHGYLERPRAQIQYYERGGSRSIAYGFHAEVEKQLAQGSNDAADLVLRRGQVEIAVEITITTGVDHEFENVKKCLAAGFSRVAVVATGRKQLEAIAAAVQGWLGSEAAAKVGYHTPDEFLAELQKLAKATELPPPSEPMAKTGKILGFEITRNFPKQTPEELRLNQQAIRLTAW